MAAKRGLVGRYERVFAQLEDRLAATRDGIARMATIAALLHARMPHYFWTGFYRLVEGELVVGPYQGELACPVLRRHEGVCWEAVRRGEPVLVPDVNAFPGHIACSARSRSELVVPVHDTAGRIVAVLDVDSARLDAFSEIDVAGLARVASLVYRD